MSLLKDVAFQQKLFVKLFTNNYMDLAFMKNHEWFLVVYDSIIAL